MEEQGALFFSFELPEKENMLDFGVVPVVSTRECDIMKDAFLRISSANSGIPIVRQSGEDRLRT